MEDKSSPDGFLINGVSYKDVLMNWLLVIADFQLNYNRLVKHLNACSGHPESPENGKLSAGQFSVGQLISLLNTMQQELERLVIDIDQYNQLCPANQKGYYTTLADHTQTVKELNKQAHRLLQLATLSSLRR